MAKKEEGPKVELERQYVIPLRREFLKVPKYQRAKKAVTAVKQFISKHMKSDDIKIGKHLNMEIWKDGIRNPPGKVQVDTKKYADGKVEVEIVGAPVEKPKEEEKKAGKKPAKKEEKKAPAKEEGSKEVKAELEKLKQKTKEIMQEKADELVTKQIESKKEEKALPAEVKEEVKEVVKAEPAKEEKPSEKK